MKFILLSYLLRLHFWRVISCGSHPPSIHILYSIPANSSEYNRNYHVGIITTSQTRSNPHSPSLRRLLHSYNPRSRPRIPIPTLIPINTTTIRQHASPIARKKERTKHTSYVSPRSADASPSSRPTRYCVSRRKSPLLSLVLPSPYKTQAQQKLTCIFRIRRLWNKSLVTRQHGASPLPCATRRSSAQGRVAAPTHRCWMPILKPDIATAKVRKRILRCRHRWRRLADAVINQMSTSISVVLKGGERWEGSQLTH